MTIINGIEIDDITFTFNDIKLAIKNNRPIEDKLNVIIVVSNPCLYARRYILLKEFVKRFEEEEDNVSLFIVELVYGDQKFIVTDKKNKRHLQLRTNTAPLWHKENMINIAVRELLPSDWKAFAWIDADIEFDSVTWAQDTLKVLNGCKDIVQLFSHCVDMNKDQLNLNIFNGFGYSFTKGKKYTARGQDYWHPGYAWAMTRDAYERLDKIYEHGVLGSSDSIMALSFIGKAQAMQRSDYHEDYNNSMTDFQDKCRGLRLGYVPGLIRHHYHGSKENRRYTERWQILMKHKFSPLIHLTYDHTNKGLMIPTEQFSQEFKDDIFNYFAERKEDDDPR